MRELRDTPLGRTSLPIPSLKGLSDEEAIGVLVEALLTEIGRNGRKIHSIRGVPEIQTVDDLIDNLRQRTPRGLSMLDLWRRVADQMEERESSPSFIIKGMMDRLGSALKRVICK